LKSTIATTVSFELVALGYLFNMYRFSFFIFPWQNHPFHSTWTVVGSPLYHVFGGCPFFILYTTYPNVARLLSIG